MARFHRSPRKMQHQSQRMARWNVARGNWFHHLTRLDGWKPGGKTCLPYLHRNVWEVSLNSKFRVAVSLYMLAGLRWPSLMMACSYVLLEWFSLCAPFRLLLAGFTFEKKQEQSKREGSSNNKGNYTLKSNNKEKQWKTNIFKEGTPESKQQSRKQADPQKDKTTACICMFVFGLPFFCCCSSLVPVCFFVCICFVSFCRHPSFFTFSVFCY